MKNDKYTKILPAHIKYAKNISRQHSKIDYAMWDYIVILQNNKILKVCFNEFIAKPSDSEVMTPICTVKLENIFLEIEHRYDPYLDESAILYFIIQNEYMKRTPNWQKE